MKRAILMVVLLAGYGLTGAFGGGGRDEGAQNGAVQAPQDQTETLSQEQRQQVQSLTAERDEARKQAEALTGDVKRLSKTPITREIIQQINDNSIFSGLDYHISIPLVLIRGGLDEAVQLQDGTLLFTETTTSTQVPIRPDDAGKLHAVALEGFRFGPAAGLDTGIFEVAFLEGTVVLGFVQNQSRNCFDLDYTRTENGKVTLHFSGAKPHLLIRYRAAFMGNTETQVILSPGVSSVSRAGAAVSAGSTTAREAPSSGDRASSPADRAAVVDLVDIVDLPDSDRSADRVVERAVEEAVPTGIDDEARIAELQRQLETVPEAALTGSNPLAQEAAVELYDPAAPLFNTGRGVWIIQIGAFAEHEHAEEAYGVLQNAGFVPARDSYQGLIRVFIPGVEETDVPSIAFIVELLGFGEPYIRR